MTSPCHLAPVPAHMNHFTRIPAPDGAALPPLDEAFPPQLAAAPHMIQVLDFNPNEGEEGAPITVRIHFHSESTEPIHVRLVVGNKAVSTTVRELDTVEYGTWQLDAAAPALGHLSTTDNRVLITVQALDAQNTVLDSVPVGNFTYWEGDEKPNPDILDHLPPIGRRRAATHLPSPSPHYSLPSPSLSDRIPRSKPRPRKREGPKSIKDHSLVRARYHSGDVDENLHAHTPILEIVTPLDSVCSGWDDAELDSGRRLVRFHKVQDGRRVILSCETIKQEEYCEADSVVSCIYREQTETCYVTSVDIIYLLERLTNDQFPVEEKNRIRRNLEGFRPTTVSKHKPGSEAFFQRIMDFPDPKPRNIEKDLKVFEWCVLGQALEKIMSKYSIYTSSPTDSTSSLPEESGSDLYHPLTHVPSHVDPSLVGKRSFGPGLLFQPEDHYVAAHPSPLSPTLPPLFPYGPDAIKHETDSSSGSWVSDEQSFSLKGTEPAFDLPVPEYEDAVGSDYGGYGRYMREEEMISF
ncbi:hypothetical protein C8R45DRAFT_115290 [Mycena sanguinolenta]|nr:hypothetical protein C8R45DRAFT_115290 [Mycena sanguinolenta]